MATAAPATAVCIAGERRRALRRRLWHQHLGVDVEDTLKGPEAWGWCGDVRTVEFGRWIAKVIQNYASIELPGISVPTTGCPREDTPGN